jgi:hypothetical protein
MRKVLSLSGLLVSTVLSSPFAVAAIPGVYVGGGVGYGIQRTPAKPLFVVSGPGSTNTVERGGLSGRAFLGYNFQRYIGMEGGFGRYARSRYSASEGTTTSSIRYYAYEADGVLKLYLPFGCTGLNVYGLGGVGVYLGQVKLANDVIPSTTAFSVGHSNIKRARPIYGAGVSFDICRFSANVEYTQLQRLGNFSTNKAPVPFSDLYTFNLSYHFY